MASTEVESTEYFWMVTRQIPVSDSGFQMSTSNGTIDVSPGNTRLDLYSKILRHVVESTPGQQLGCVVFFSLEPNQL